VLIRKSGVVKVHQATWLLRLMTVLAPFACGPLIGTALADRSRDVQVTGTSSAWVIWGITLLAAAVPHPVSLTAIRITGPALGLGSFVAAVTDPAPDWLTGVGVATALVVAVLSCTAWFADDAVDARSYGDEQRFTLATPGALIVGPVPLAWLVIVATAVGGPLLLAARSWLLGTVVVVIGGTLSWFAVRSLHSLSNRFAVFVPAGLTLVDPMVLADAVLFPRRRIVALAPALRDTTGRDLSQGARGLALEVHLDAPAELTIRTGRTEAEATSVDSVVFTPSRPGAVLNAAKQRSIRVN